MKLSLMDKKISIHLKSKDTDEYGAIVSYAGFEKCEVWAKVEQVFKVLNDGEREFVSGERNFVIRARNDVDEQDVIVYKNKEYEIYYVKEINRNFYVLHTREIL